MLDRPARLPATYPMIRGLRPVDQRWRRARRWVRAHVGRRTLIAIGAAAALAVLAVAGVALYRFATRPDPRVQLGQAIAAIRRGDYGAARDDARAALSQRPDWALAHAVLARIELLRDDGAAADAAIGRARVAGFPEPRLRHLAAHAAILQGDDARAIAEAARAAPRYARYARRVRAIALADQGDRDAAIGQLLALIATDPRDAAAWTALGRIRYRAGDLAGASDAAARAVAAARYDPAALTLMGEVVRSRYGLAGALPWFQQALDRDAAFHPALIELAATLGDLGRNADMLAASRRALAVRPGSPPALYLQAVLAARAGRIDLARALLARTDGALGAMPGALLLTGALAFAAGKPQAAAAAWQELLAAQPMNLVARRLLGAAMLSSGDPRGALAVLRPMALRADSDAYTLMLAARAFEAAGERDWAARYLDRAAAAGVGASPPFGNDVSLPVLAAAAAEMPRDPSVAVEYVRGLIEAGRIGEALARAETIAGASPGAPAAQLLVGDTLMTAGQPAAALARYRAAASLDFGTPALLRLVEAGAAAGQPQQAARALALYLDQNPASLVARRVQANLLLDARDWPAAIAVLEGLRAATGSRDHVILSQLAIAHAGAEDAGSARAFGAAAYRLAPTNAAAADAYGWARYLSGDVAGALQLVGKAHRLAPADARIGWHRAQLLAEAGRTAAARAAITALLADPAFPERPAARALLAAL